MDTTPVRVDSIRRITDNAVLIEIDGEEVWLPKSLIDRFDDNWVAGDEDILMDIVTWKVKQLNL